MKLLIKLGPGAARETPLSKKVHGVTEVFVASPACLFLPDKICVICEICGYSLLQLALRFIPLFGSMGIGQGCGFIGRLSIGVQGEEEWLGFLELKDPGALLELVTVMELGIGIVRGSLDLHL
jgi:hypothetical protein